MAAGEIKVEHHYDPEADVLYVSFADDEPTYTENVDDLLYLEIGWFSETPKGFRVVGPRANNVKSIGAFLVKQIKRKLESRRKELKQEENIFSNMFKHQLNEMLAAQS